MALEISIDGGDRVPVKSAVIYDGNTPLAAVIQHGNMILYADSVRDADDLRNILNTLQVFATPARAANIVLGR